MRINCKEVGFKNFLSFGSKWQEVPFKQGINFVTGWDTARNKSNGAGKSSLLESVIFALYGKTARNIKKEQIVNWKNKKNCEVVFRFDINNDQYEIMRSIKPDKLEIYKNGSLLPQDAHVKDYQTMFEEDIFGLDLKMFTNLVHSNANSSANILSLSKPDKRKLMEKMFDLSVFSKMNEICNEKLRKLEGQAAETELRVQSSLEKMAQAQSMIDQFKQEIVKKSRLEKDLAELLIEFKELVDDHPNIEVEIEDVNQSIQDHEDHLAFRIKEVEKKETEIRVKLEHVENDLKEFDGVDEIIAKNKQLNGIRKKLVDVYGDVERITEFIEKLKESIKTWTEENNNIDKDVREIDKEIIKLQADLENCENNRDLLKTGKCPVCGTNVKDSKKHYGKEIASIKRKITSRKKKIDPLEERMEKNDNDIVVTQKDMESLQEAKEKILVIDSQIKDVPKQKDSGELKAKKDKYEKALKVIDEKKVQVVQESKRDIQHFENKKADLTEEFNKIKRKEKEVETLKTQVDSEKENIKSFEKMIKEQEEIIKGIIVLKEELESTMKKRHTLQDYLNSIKVLLKDERIKQHMISKIMPYLNKQANYYLSEVDYSFYIKIDKWLDIDIRGPGITNATYDSLSGGERRGIDLAIQLGFLDIARTQAGIFPDFLTFDELLDSSIDGQGIGEILKIVRVKQRETNGKFFIISHRSEIDNELIDNQYHVVKENGYSRIIL